MGGYREALRIADSLVLEQGGNVAMVPGAVRAVYLIGQLDFEVTVGGVEQWLTNSSGRYTAETISALVEVGAHRCAEIVREIVSSFPHGRLPLDDADRVALIGRLMPLQGERWRDLSEMLLDWPDDIDALLRRHVAEHEGDFVGR